MTNLMTKPLEHTMMEKIKSVEQKDNMNSFKKNSRVRETVVDSMHLVAAKKSISSAG